MSLARIRPVHLTLMGGAVGLERLRTHKSLAVEEREWGGMDRLFAALANECDLGLVPNIEGEGASGEVDFTKVHIPGQEWPQISYKYKGSANGGRALVMAQVGLPFIASPEFEALELIGNARLPSAELIAVDDWAAKITTLADAHHTRSSYSDALREYCEAYYTVAAFVAPLDTRLKRLYKENVA
jgi:hypothetical protein